jgi:hypothetical protein
MRSCSVILGPRTRLGLELVHALAGPPAERILIARDQRDATLLVGLDPGAIIAQVGAPLPELPARCDRLAIYICALGPVHAGDEDLAAHAAAALRELGVIRDLLAQVPSRAFHVVHVSSVLARIGPRSSRAYYAGFKNLVEGRLAALVAEHGGGKLSVVHPGRLRSSRSALRPRSLLETSYRRLARRLIRIATRNRARRITVGIDARLLTLARSAAECWRALVSY